MELIGTGMENLVDIDVSFDYIHQGISEQISADKKHILIFVYAGKLLLTKDQQQITINRGECVFIKSNTTEILVSKNPAEGEKFQGIAWGLGYSFLYNFHRNFSCSTKFNMYVCFTKNIVKLSPNVYIESFYVSLKPYLYYNIKPPVKILELKSKEVVYCILISDIRLYYSLFSPIYLQKNLEYPN